VEDGQFFWIAGNVGSHPAVLCPEFGFFNSDGSTTGKINLKDPTPDLVLAKLQEISIDFIFNQIH